VFGGVLDPSTTDGLVDNLPNASSPTTPGRQYPAGPNHQYRGFSDAPTTVHNCHRHTPEDYERAVKKLPLQRIGDPRPRRRPVAFLLGDDATFITAQTIHMDGGTGSFR